MDKKKSPSKVPKKPIAKTPEPAFKSVKVNAMRTLRGIRK